MINNLFKSKYFPQLFKIITLLVFIGIIVNGFSASSNDSAILKQLRNTNIANLFVWSYWWPLIIVGAILFGRIWCMVCPVELITSISAKLGLKRKRPKWVLSGWVITLFYLIILVVGLNIFAIHRNPTYMAIYLVALVLLAILVGFIYEKNTFCRYVCPVGHLLGIYSRLAFWKWDIKDKSVCEGCKNQSCVHKNYRYQLNFKSCGVDLHPSKIEGNTDCILCAGCLKTCGTYQKVNNEKRPNPGLLKTSFASGLLNAKPLKSAECFFLFILSGFVIYEILSEFSDAKSVLLYPVNYLKNIIGAESKTVGSLIKSFYLFFILPGIFWFLPFLITRFGKINLSLKNYLQYLSLSFIPIVAAAHFSKALLKTSSRVPYFKHLTNDIQGMSNADAIVSGQIILKTIPQEVSWLVTVLITILLILGIIYSTKTVNVITKRLSLQQRGSVLLIAPILYFLIFFIDIVIWRWIG